MSTKLYKSIAKTLGGNLSAEILETIRENLTTEEYKIWHEVTNYILIEILNKAPRDTRVFNTLVSKEIKDNMFIGGYIDLLLTNELGDVIAIDFSKTNNLELALLGHIANANETWTVSYSSGKVGVIIITKEEAEEMFNNYVRE